MLRLSLTSYLAHFRNALSHSSQGFIYPVQDTMDFLEWLYFTHVRLERPLSSFQKVFLQLDYTYNSGSVKGLAVVLNKMRVNTWAGTVTES